MLERLQNRRLIVMTMALLLGFAGLVYRLVDVQVLRRDELSQVALEKTELQTVHPARRGDILDRNGDTLATSIAVKRVCADPLLIEPYQAVVARAIAPLLEMDPAELAAQLRLRPRVEGDWSSGTNRFEGLKRNVPVERWEEIKRTMLALDFGLDESALTFEQRQYLNRLRRTSVYAEPVDGQLRVYPNGRLAAHVLGFVGRGFMEVNGTRVEQLVGREGIEHTLEGQLSGVPGWRQTERDRRGREYRAWRIQDVPARNGMNAVLTIDSVLQLILESELAAGVERHDPVSVCGTIINPRTGEILAMAALPSFDPANPGEAQADHRRNRIIKDVMEPGSTFKIVPIAGAIEDGVVSLQTPIDCEQGAYYYGGHTLHDHHPYPILSVEGVVQKSSNIGAAKIGIRLGAERLQQHLLNFGFGRPTGVPLEGELSGIVHDVSRWSKVSIAQIPMGHGIAVTPMQMSMAMCAIANDGVMMKPMLVSRLQNDDGAIAASYEPRVSHRVLSSATARAMVEALKTVTRPGGTAVEAALDHYTVAGKTGTAQKPSGGTYQPGKYVSSFIGFFPADDPVVCIGIYFDEPRRNGYYGGLTAAPVFQRVAQRASTYLGIEPDRRDEAPKPSFQTALIGSRPQ